MRKIVFNKKFLIVVGLCLSVAGGLFIKNKVNTKASDNGIQVEHMSVTYAASEGDSEEILEEDVDETISQEVVALDKQKVEYNIGDIMNVDDNYFVPMETEVQDDVSYQVVGGIKTQKGNFVIKINSDKKISNDDVKNAIEAVQEELQ
ncbi:MAG: hypothetical protein PHD70_01755 [Anaerostipes sp.]|nr:hypothetical protein [Anaerostipes sp.]